MGIRKVKETFEPLYYKGERFRIIKRETDINLLPIVAQSLRTKEVYGFEPWELV